MVDSDLENWSEKHSEMWQKMTGVKKNQSSLERNCNQIFTKGPALTKDFLVKVNTDMIPSKTYLFGQELNTRRLLFVSGLMLLFSCSFLGAIVMWCTRIYENSILQMIVISNTSQTYDFWRRPTPQPVTKFYVFNYTNIEEYENGTHEKLNVKELGPYAYREKLERVNVVFNNDGTVSYQEKRTYSFAPELSKGNPDDIVMVPNVPVLMGASIVKKMNYLVRLSYSGFLNTLNEKPFVRISVNDFILGYKGDLYELSKNWMRINHIKYYDEFGLLAWRKGVQHDLIRVNTGEKDINKLGKIEKFNDKSAETYWRTQECNSYKGSDGSIFPSKDVKNKKDIYIYTPQMCRNLKFHFNKENKIMDGVIPSYEYETSEDIFDSSKNDCYCTKDNDECPTKGLFNATLCVQGAPIFFSLPQFQSCDKKLRESLTGLDPSNKPRKSTIQVHPTMGFIMEGEANFQVNIQLQKSFGVSQLKPYEDNIVLPLAWLQTGLKATELPEDVKELIYSSTYVVKYVELGLRFGTLLTCLVTFLCILLVVRRVRNERKKGNLVDAEFS